MTVNTMTTKAATFLIDVYQKTVSPFLPGSCRYSPTCSEFAKEAIARKGLLRGSFSAFLRILRCNPLFPGGYDPVR
jgi:putative membrane protein insertion efficiency factor